MNNLMKNITPSIAVMAVGLAGAFFVYNVYFKNDVNMKKLLLKTA